jgi:hypothetical protein
MVDDLNFESGRELHSMVRNLLQANGRGIKWTWFAAFLDLNHEFSGENCLGNNHEGLIPFTHSIDSQ